MVTITHVLTLPDGRIIRATISARAALDRAPVVYEGAALEVMTPLATCAPITLDVLFQTARDTTGGEWQRAQSQPWPDESDLRRMQHRGE